MPKRKGALLIKFRLIACGSFEISNAVDQMLMQSVESIDVSEAFEYSVSTISSDEFDSNCSIFGVRVLPARSALLVVAILLKKNHKQLQADTS